MQWVLCAELLDILHARRPSVVARLSSAAWRASNIADTTRRVSPWRPRGTWTCAGQIDLKEHGLASGEGFIDGSARRSVLVFSMNKRPLQHVSAFDHCIELLSGNEVVVDAVQFTGPRIASCCRDRHVERREALRQRRDNSSLSNGCRASEDSQLSLCHDSSVPRLTASAETLDERLPLDGAEATHAPALGDLVLVHQDSGRVRADARQRLQ